jgi:hypothetical protein
VKHGTATAGSPAAGRSVDPRLSAHRITGLAAELPVYSLMLPVRAGGCHPTRCPERQLARRSSTRPLSPVPSGWLRPRSLNSVN